MNELTLYGRLTRDPELAFAKTGNAVARATIAVNYGTDKVTFVHGDGDGDGGSDNNNDNDEELSDEEMEKIANILKL